MFTTIDETMLAGVQGGGVLGTVGQGFGFGAGVAVTGALAFVPGWNQQVPGQPAGFQKRHESVVGPQIASYANGLSPGPWKELTSGVAAGATAAPRWSFEHGL